jgi:hypothetical protein
MKKYFYTDGQEVMVNDVVLTTPGRYAHVQLLLEPESQLANSYSAPDGGIVLKFDDGDYQVWPQADEDMSLIRHVDQK